MKWEWKNITEPHFWDVQLDRDKKNRTGYKEGRYILYYALLYNQY